MSFVVLHVFLRVGGDTVLMGSDKGDWGAPILFGNNFSVSVLTEETKEADRIFNALSNGGTVTMPMAKQFWGA